MSTTQQIKSFETTLRELGPRQAEVLRELATCRSGLSAWELAGRLKRMVHAVRPRLTELKSAGLIRQSGNRYEQTTDRDEAVWVLTQTDDSGQMVFA